VVCHSGVGLTPVIDGKTLHFSAGGLFNGLVLLFDDETGSYWDHITGECVHGPSKGKKMPGWGIEMTNVEAELKRGNPPLLRSKPTFIGRIMGFFTRNAARNGGFFPPGFRGTMETVDPRLPEMEYGLGVVVDGVATFYPMALLADGLIDGELHIQVDPDDGIPVARISNGEERPFQLFSRWYGFSLTWPRCRVYSATASSEPSAA
jgi:hypothetical protein